MPPRYYLSALEVEEIGDLLSHGGHDSGVEERVETGKQECADDDCDKDLDAGIDVACGLHVLDCGLGADGQYGYLVLDGVEKLLHIKYLVLSYFEWMVGLRINP